MKVAPTFHKPIVDSSLSKVNAGHWDTVLDLYGRGYYKAAVIGILIMWIRRSREEPEMQKEPNSVYRMAL